MSRGLKIDALFKATDRFSRPVARMGKSTQRVARKIGNSFRRINRQVDAATAKFRAAGTAMAGLALPVGIAGAAIVKTGADFEQAITNVGAVGLKTRDEIAELEAKATKLGATTKFTATEAADGMEIMAKAGFKTGEIMSGIDGILSAAAASGLELAEVSDHVSNVLKGMGLETSEASRVADVLALASSRTNSSIGTLGESMRNVSSTARQFNIPLEDVVAGVAALQDVGLDASVAGSAMNTMLTKLAKPTDAMAAKLKGMGVGFQDSEGNALPFMDVIANISKASKAAGGNMDQVALLADLVGLRGQKAAANLKDLFDSGKLTSLSDELKNAGGSAKQMADLRMDTLIGDWTLFGSAVDGVMVKLFGLKGGALRSVLQDLTKWVTNEGPAIVEGVASFFKAISDNLPLIEIWWGRLKRIAIVLGAVALAVKVVAVAMAIANPFGLVIAALAIVAAFWPEISGAAVAAWDAIGSAVGAFVDWATVESYAFAGLIIRSWDSVAAAGGRAWGNIKAWGKSAYEFVTNAWSGLGDFFNSLWDSVAAAFTSIVGPIMDTIRGVIDGIGSLGGGGGDDASGQDSGAVNPVVVSQSEAISRSFSESRQTLDVNIKDPGGRASVAAPSGRVGGLQVSHSGAF